MEKRIVKEPEIRKQEILDTAMKLFNTKGFEATSIADIAREMSVVPSLCYKYFSSKQEIFVVATNQFANKMAIPIIELIKNRELTFQQRLNMIGLFMLQEEKEETKEDNQYHEYYHTAGNEVFHFQVSYIMMNIISPIISEELSYLHSSGEIPENDYDLLADFIVYGLTSIVLDFKKISYVKKKEKVETALKYVYKLLQIDEPNDLHL